MPSKQPKEQEQVKAAGAGILDDELPQPPAHNVADDVPFDTGAAFDGSVPDELWQTIPDENEPIKDGTYRFRLDGFKKGYTQMYDPTERKFVDDLNKPLYKLAWKCQEEPYVGRVIFDNRMSWASAQDIMDANNPSSPRNAEAHKTVNDRMKAPRMFLKALRVQLKTFGNNFDAFLATNPECRIRVKATEGMESTGEVKDGKKVYKGTGKLTNNDIKEYLPLSGR